MDGLINYEIWKTSWMESSWWCNFPSFKLVISPFFFEKNSFYNKIQVFTLLTTKPFYSFRTLFKTLHQKQTKLIPDMMAEYNEKFRH